MLVDVATEAPPDQVVDMGRNAGDFKAIFQDTDELTAGEKSTGSGEASACCRFAWAVDDGGSGLVREIGGRPGLGRGPASPVGPWKGRAFPNVSEGCLEKPGPGSGGTDSRRKDQVPASWTSFNRGVELIT